MGAGGESVDVSPRQRLRRALAGAGTWPARLLACKLYRGRLRNGAVYAVPLVALVQAAIITIGALTVELLNPLSVGSASDRQTEGLFLRLVAPFYGGGSGRTSDDITVVLLDDYDLGVLNEASGESPPPHYWPPSYRLHAEVLDAILSFAPRAVFVDIAFMDRRPGQGFDALRAVVQDYAGPKGPRIPVVLASGRLGTTGPRIREELLKAGGRAAYVGYDAEPYRLYEPERELPSAALALFRAGRALDNATPSEDPRGCIFSSDLDGCAGSLPPMSLYWSVWPGEPGRALRLRECVRDTRSTWRYLEPLSEITLRPLLGVLALAWRQFDEAGAAGFTESLPPVRQSCPPFETLSASDLLVRADADLLSQLFEERYVLYGANFEMATDLFEPPTHGPTEGVFRHAMALDNLLRRGARYHRAIGEPWASLWEGALLYGFLLLHIASLRRAEVEVRCRHCSRRLLDRLRALAIGARLALRNWLLMALVGIGLSLLIFFLGDWAPGNLVFVFGAVFSTQVLQVVQRALTAVAAAGDAGPPAPESG